MSGFVGFLSFSGRLLRETARADLQSMIGALPSVEDADDLLVSRRFYAPEAAFSALERHVGQAAASIDDMLICLFHGTLTNRRGLRRALEQSGAILRSTGDAELILQGYREWGRDVVSRLQGAFSLAIWDGYRREVHLCRDRIGQRGLLLASDGRSCVFATNLHALLCHPQIGRQINLDGVHDYLTYGTTLGPQTLIVGVERVPPNTLLTISHDGRRQSVDVTNSTATAPAQETRWTRRRAVRELTLKTDDALREAWPLDGHVGALYDGSPASAWMIERLRAIAPKRVPVFYAADAYEERGRLGASERASAIPVDIGSECIDAMSALYPWLDGPVGQVGPLSAHVVALGAQEQCSHLISALGGEQLLLTAQRYVDLAATALAPPEEEGQAFVSPEYGPALRRDWLADHHAVMSEKDKQAAYGPALMDRLFLPSSDRLGCALEDADLDTLPRAFAQTELASLINGGHASELAAVTESVGITAVLGLMNPDLRSWLGGVPQSFLTQDRDDTIQPGGLVLEALGTRATAWSAGFLPPLDRWVRGRWRQSIEEVLLDPSTLGRGELQESYVNAVVTQHMTGEADHGRLILALMGLEIWRRRVIEEVNTGLIARGERPREAARISATGGSGAEVSASPGLG
ncbi:MAG: hypothetical protein AAFV62_08255 [Pseudomonadota bacterium]